MPIYAYRCNSCGHSKDVLQKLSDPLLTLCPACGQEAFSKQLTAAGFQLKGSGWYVTDFRGGEAGKASDGANSGVGTEAKPAVKSDAKAADSASAPAAAPAAAASPAPASAPAASPAPAAKSAPKSVASPAPSAGA
jgi:putative FmdB family regulatory protein